MPITNCILEYLIRNVSLENGKGKTDDEVFFLRSCFSPLPDNSGA